MNRRAKSIPKQALVVDDMSVIRQLLMAILKHIGFECLGASNGSVALDLLAKRKFDLVLCDWNMPGMNGSELVRAIRVTYPSIPIIMVTAESDPKRVAELRDLGVSGYVVKPFKPPVLVKLVEKIFPSRLD
jgi:two-component system chemotaxis response regulator CheY